jgi:hypothetical protein
LLLGKLCILEIPTFQWIPTLVKNHAGGRVIRSKYHAGIMVIRLALKIRAWRCLAARIMLPDLGMPLKYIYQPADPAIRR